MHKFIINSPSRIHLGFLELNPESDRIFGSLGLTISNFKTSIKIDKSQHFKVKAKNENKIFSIVNKFQKHYSLKPCKISILETIPEHIGLGSGTQLSLNIGYALSKFSGLNLSLERIACILDRGKRSGVGIGSFKLGGFLIDGGKQKNSNDIPPIIFREKWPKKWKIILLFDSNSEGIHGNRELQEFKKINKVKKNLSKKNYQSLVQSIMPSLIEKNFKQFCDGIQMIQNNTAKIFNKSQGGNYNSNGIAKIFNFLQNSGYSGFGQSSWGPTGFIICENIKKQQETINLIEEFNKNNFIKNIKMIKVEDKNHGFKLTKD